MSAIVKPHETSPPPENEEDPWRFGWRYVRRIGPDGETWSEQVPLTQEDLLFPEEEDFVVHTEGHNDDCRYLKTVLQTWAAARQGALVLSDHRVDFGVAGVRPLGPDVVVFDGLREPWDRDRGTLPVAEFGARVLLVVEVTSPENRAQDFGVKLDFFHRAGAAFYAVVDRRMLAGGLDLRLFGYRNTPEGFQPVALDSRGWLWLESLSLWLAVEDGRAVLYDEEGERMPDYHEAVVKASVAQEARREAEQARREADRRAASEQQARREADRRAASEQQARREADRRASAEAEARQALEARMRELEAELNRLRGEKEAAS